VLRDRKQYDQRFYRAWHEKSPLDRFELKIEQSDLRILCIKAEAERALRAARADIKRKIHTLPEFEHALAPLHLVESDPLIIRQMTDASATWSVGPMAAVAGAIAESVARAVSPHSRTVIVENGGDIYAISPNTVRFALYAGEDSPFKNTLTFETDASRGVAICTSSGKIGPSLSLGLADAVVAIHERGSAADAAATAIANEVKSPTDIETVIDQTKSKGELLGLIACMTDKLGMWGAIQLVKTETRTRPIH
jgi:ApbE superfamily uncharacterized protein (UPF0280 family)